MAFKKPYTHYFGTGPWTWRRGTGDTVYVEILPLDLQPGGNPWVFQPLDDEGEPDGDPVAIEDKDLYRMNAFSTCPSGVAG